MSDSCFRTRTNVKRVQELIEFGAGKTIDSAAAQLQAEGVAALYNRLCGKGRFAYLADEVGMGKTYQALGVASVLWAQKPDARVVFISPKANLQTNFENAFQNFYRYNYLAQQGVGRSRGRGKPAVHGCRAENLREFAVDLRLPARQAFFLRMTSFRRPIAVSQDHGWKLSRERYCDTLARIGLGAPDAETLYGLNEDRKTCESHSNLLNLAFADAFREFLGDLSERRDGPAIDLLVIDEAQSLRNSDNQTNSILRRMFTDDKDKHRVAMYIAY